MGADLLLRWVSETGHGSIRSLRERAAWLARDTGQAPTRRATGRWVRDLATLAHIDLDWATDRWSAAQPVLTRLPGGDGFALLTGARPVALEDALEQVLEHHGLDLVCLPQAAAPEDLPAPTVLLVQYNAVDELQHAAGALGASHVPCAALALSRSLPALAAGEPAAPPSERNMTLERLDPATLTFRPLAPARQRPPGLYLFRSLGRSRYLFHDAACWRHCDPPNGIFLELARLRRSALRWRAETARGREEYGHLFADLGAPLPDAHRRALALCSGLLPRFSTRARTAIYDNVPRQVAERVAASLHQHLDDA